MSDLERPSAGAEVPHRHLDAGLDLRAGTNAVGVPCDEDLEVLAARTVAQTMRAPFADLRPQSGTLANLASYAGLIPVGATIAAIPVESGGHVSHHDRGAAGIRAHPVVNLPIDAERQDVDVDALPEFLARARPRLIVLGGTVQLFPNDVRSVVESAAGVAAQVVFDAAQTAGLIPGGAFPNPLDEGAAAMTFSTDESYGGPPGGAVVTRDSEVARRIGAAVFPGLTADYDVNRLRPLHAAATALLRDGRRYGALCIASARSLAAAFVAQEVDVMAAARGYTATSQVLVRMRDKTAAGAAVRRCAACGVYLSATVYRDEQGAGAAVRLGVQELVRRGLGPADMPQVAAVVAGLLRAELPRDEARRMVEGLRELMAEPGQLNRSWPVEVAEAVAT